MNAPPLNDVFILCFFPEMALPLMMCLYYDFLPRNGPPFNDTFIFYSPEMPLPSLLPLVPLLSLLTTGQGQQTPASPPPMSSHSDSCNMIYSSISKYT